MVPVVEYRLARIGVSFKYQMLIDFNLVIQYLISTIILGLQLHVEHMSKQVLPKI